MKRKESLYGRYELVKQLRATLHEATDLLVALRSGGVMDDPRRAFIRLAIDRLALAGCRSQVLNQLTRTDLELLGEALLDPAIKTEDVAVRLPARTRRRLRAKRSALYRYAALFAWSYDTVTRGVPLDQARHERRSIGR